MVLIAYKQRIVLAHMPEMVAKHLHSWVQLGINCGQQNRRDCWLSSALTATLVSFVMQLGLRCLPRSNCFLKMPGFWRAFISATVYSL